MIRPSFANEVTDGRTATTDGRTATRTTLTDGRTDGQTDGRTDDGRTDRRGGEGLNNFSLDTDLGRKVERLGHKGLHYLQAVANTRLALRPRKAIMLQTKFQPDRQTDRTNYYIPSEFFFGGDNKAAATW
ncbi:hypothetical protein DPMN_169080 [Dreissena polymorpha]|uniref:Uncharacterized protein n=1 Tax=Dreissena polymorpha TaxID=45954 RepID=A0A9D4F331_DREPO|nr:hypothetical protein DPMN_169080 [Dreissena polymorpha]